VIVKLFRDTWLIFSRQMLLVVRTPIRLVIGFAQPIAYLILFAPLLKSALAPLGATTYADAYRIYVPGLLVILLMLGSFFAGFTLLAELREGVIERSRVTPISRFALLFGRALSEVVTLLGQAVIITIVALPLGLRVKIGPLLLAYLLLGLIGMLAASVSYGVALRIKNPAALGPLVNVVSQPLSLLSGVLLPLALAPAWLLTVAKINPFYWGTNGVRGLFDGDVGARSVWEGMVVMLVLSSLAVWWATQQFTRKVA
jgi:ABC-2 type transport system permease protein